MGKISIFLTNLGKYNEGYLTGEWVKLPIDENDLERVLARIGISDEYEEYRRLCKKLKPGDTLFIKSIDRLGRNYNEILEQWRFLTKEKRIAIVVLDMPLLDTRKDRDLTGELIADIVLQLLSYVAQTEREFIHQRQAEGIAAAKARGVHFGRQAIPLPPEFHKVYQHWKNQNLSARKAGALLGVTHQTFLKWARQQENTL